MVTRCKHYFCEQCALKHNATSPKCFVCDAPTSGIFNVAHDILAKQKKADLYTGDPEFKALEKEIKITWLK